MFKVPITLQNVETVKKFCNEIAHLDFDIDIVSGRHAVDAKSMMGIFAMDLSKEVELRAYTDNEHQIQQIQNILKQL